MNWTLVDRKLILRYRERDFFWNMPEGFRMPGPALLSLAEHLLLAYHGIKVKAVGQRSSGGRTALAYSGGVDSTAALKFLPGALPIYTDVARPSNLHKKENALLALKHVGGVAITTDSDEIPVLHGRARGFYGGGGFTATSVLLADHFDLGIVADGNVLETIYLHSAQGHGTKYTPKNYDSLIARFGAAGLRYCLPCAGLTEVSTTKLADDNPYAMGCMRGVGGVPCGNCAKCYRKQALQGYAVLPNKESEAKMSKRLIPMLPSLLWAARNKGLRHPALDGMNKDISWVDKWYPDSIKYIPDELRSHFLEKIREYGICHLQDDAPIRTWSSER